VSRHSGPLIGKPGVSALERAFHDVDHDCLGPEPFSSLVFVWTPDPLSSHACLRMFSHFYRYLVGPVPFWKSPLSRYRIGRHIGAEPGRKDQHGVLIKIRSSDQFGSRTEKLAGPIIVDIQMQPNIAALALPFVESEFGERERNQHALNRRH